MKTLLMLLALLIFPIVGKAQQTYQAPTFVWPSYQCPLQVDNVLANCPVHDCFFDGSGNLIIYQLNPNSVVQNSGKFPNAQPMSVVNCRMVQIPDPTGVEIQISKGTTNDSQQSTPHFVSVAFVSRPVVGGTNSHRHRFPDLRFHRRQRVFDHSNNRVSPTV